METMNSKKPPPDDKRTESDGIPVYELWFSAKYDTPSSSSHGGQGRLRASASLTITLLPRAQFYRVVEKSRDPKNADIEFFVPREWALYVPLRNQKL